MAASAKVEETVRGISAVTKQVADTLILFHRAKAALRGPGHATSATIGDIAPFAAVAGNIPMGAARPHKAVSAGSDESVTGDASASPEPTAGVELEAYLLERKAVTGVTDDADSGKLVYLSDDDTLDIARPAIAIPVGIIVIGHSAAVATIFMFSFEAMVVIAIGGGGKTLVNLGHFDGPTLANGDIRTAMVSPAHGLITEVFAMVDIAVTGGGATVLINLEINGTNLTGGVVTIAENDAKGDKKAGTAVTADNRIHEGDLIDIEAAALSALTTGTFDLYMVVEGQPGL